MVALEAALQFEDTRESMQAFCVGQYMEVSTVTLLLFWPSTFVSFFFFFNIEIFL